MNDLDKSILLDLAELGIDYAEDEPQTFSSKREQNNKKLNFEEKRAKSFLDKMHIRTSTIKNKTYQIIENVINDLVLPKKGEQIRIRTQQQINLISMVLKVAHSNIIDELSIMTYTFNREALGIVLDLIRSKQIKKFNLILASSYSFRDPKYYEELKSVFLGFQNKNIHLSFAWSHLKVTLAKCGNNYYQIEGSMNYSTNNMAENLVFENCKNTYDFDKKVFNIILKGEGRKNKALEYIC